MTTLHVIGKPAPKGSKKGFVNPHTQRVVLTESAGKSLHSWEQAIIRACEDHLDRLPAPPMRGPLAMKISFRFQTVASAPHRYWHAVKPDIDKLERAVLDALKQGGLISDDCIIAKLSGSKRYITDTESPGCQIDIEDLAGEEQAIQERRKDEARRARHRPATDENQQRLPA